jgi:hypothetical protein
MSAIDLSRHEHTDLTQKIFELQSFIYDNTDWQELTSYDQSLLYTQLDYMSSYANVLEKRIKFYEEKV